MRESLQGKVAIVTGAASGIGAATARRLAEEGALLVLNDLDGEALRGISAQIHEAGHTHPYCVEGDVSNPAIASALADMAVNRTGRIDVLVNNAGMMFCRDLTETTPDDWDRVVAVNMKSMYLCCRSVLPVMVAQASGAIVNVSSVSGFVGMEFGGESTWLYSVTKAAAIQFTRSLASRYAADGIRVNAVAPGPTRTSQLRNSIPGLTEDQENLMWNTTGAEKTLLGRVGKPGEIAAAITFLASGEASFITGTHILADGGYLVR